MPGSASTASRPKRKPSLADAKKAILFGPALLLLAIVALDQWTKLWAVAALGDGRSVPVLGSTFMWTLVYNEGGAMGTSFGPSGYYLVTALVILPLLLWYTWKNRFDAAMIYPLASIVAGAIGNVIDRIRIGKVVDFIDVDLPDLDLFGYQLQRWYTFNIADAAITCAIAFILIGMMRNRPAPETQAALQSETTGAPTPGAISSKHAGTDDQ